MGKKQEKRENNFWILWEDLVTSKRGGKDDL